MEWESSGGGVGCPRVRKWQMLVEKMPGEHFSFLYDNGGTIITIEYRAFYVQPQGYINIGTVFIP